MKPFPYTIDEETEYTVVVEDLGYTPPANCSPHLVDSDIDYYGWFEPVWHFEDMGGNEVEDPAVYTDKVVEEVEALILDRLQEQEGE